MTLLSRETARTAARRIGIDLVFGSDRRLFGTKQSVDDAEREKESDTHRELREAVIWYCTERVQLDIYPANVGRRGVFAMADLLLWRAPARMLFVELLASEQAVTVANIENKRRLGTDAAPIVFFMTGFDFECWVGDGDELGWSGGPGWDGPRLEDKRDIFHSGILEDRLTKRGMLRKKRCWMPEPTMYNCIRRHFGFGRVKYPPLLAKR